MLLVAAYENNLYTGVPHGFYLHMYSKYADEAINTAPCCGANIVAQNTYNHDNIAQANSWDFWGGFMYYWTKGYQFALSGPIYAGTNEIQRNVIAERVLGMPRR